jgi:hypothetical protein
MRDADVRVAVRERLAGEHMGDGDTRVVEEMGIWNGAVRVDLAVINGELTGYEIKSARDTLTRLPAQAALYSAVFDRVHIVAAEKHVTRARDAIPRWWGIMVATGSASSKVALEVMRPSRINRRLHPIQLARLLWRDEAIGILEHHNAARGIRSASREIVAARVVEALDLDGLRHEVRSCLKARRGWLGQAISDPREVPVCCET